MRQREQRDGVQVPVDRPGQRQHRREREHRGVPGTSTGQRSPSRRPPPRRPARGRSALTSKKRRDRSTGEPSEGTSCAVTHITAPVSTGYSTCWSRRLPDVRDVAVGEPAREVERRDVAVAGVACTAPGATQASVPARVLLHEAEAAWRGTSVRAAPATASTSGAAGEGPAAERPAEHLAAEADEGIVPRGCDDAARRHCGQPLPACWRQGGAVSRRLLPRRRARRPGRCRGRRCLGRWHRRRGRGRCRGGRRGGLRRAGA